MLKILAAASEIFPLVKTGGLADVVGALPVALRPHGVAVKTLVPGYPAILAALPKGEDHLMRALEVSGNERLAAEVMWLVRHLRGALPDIAEEDLSRLFGDVAAHRLAQGARDFMAWQADAARRLAGAFADYAIEETRMLVGRAEHDAFAAAVSRLRDAVERLEKRIAPLG